jgi:N-acetyl-gamma-glutamyl-phosphate reductase
MAAATETEVQTNAQIPSRHSREPVRVAVVGATGYAGRELVAILARHPGVRITRLMSSGREAREAFAIEKSHPALRANTALKSGDEPGGTVLCEPLNAADLTPSAADLVFLATPHATSHEVVPSLLANGLRVIDLSGAFRLKQSCAYPRWYGFEHHGTSALE